METMPPFRRKRLRLADFNYADPNYIYFATICARYPTRPFLNDALAQEVIKAIHWSREHQRWVVYCYCLMPDHLHLVLSPGPAGMSLSECFRAFKRWTTRKTWEHGVHGRLWQRSWYDHIARKDEDVLAMCRYVLANPVRKGLVENPEDWPFSGMPDPLPL